MREEMTENFKRYPFLNDHQWVFFYSMNRIFTAIVYRECGTLRFLVDHKWRCHGVNQIFKDGNK